jgi:lipid A 3-O-deacylase
VHDGKIPRIDAGGRRVDLGSRILFEPEISVGYRVSRRVSAEAAWTHISNAQLFSKQNPGLDMMGVRLAFALGQTD